MLWLGLLVLCMLQKNLLGPREQRKKLTTPSLHQEFIKGTYTQGVSWVAVRHHGCPPWCVAGAKGLYRTGQDGWGCGVWPHQLWRTSLHASLERAMVVPGTTMRQHSGGVDETVSGDFGRCNLCSGLHLPGSTVWGSTPVISWNSLSCTLLSRRGKSGPPCLLDLREKAFSFSLLDVDFSYMTSIFRSFPSVPSLWSIFLSWKPNLLFK